MEKKLKNREFTVNLPGDVKADRIEIIILPMADAVPAESRARMAAFKQTGFVREVLAAEEEEVWNDL